MFVYVDGVKTYITDFWWEEGRLVCITEKNCEIVKCLDEEEIGFEHHHDSSQDVCTNVTLDIRFKNEDI